eukprot:GHVT01100618.1.p1 GENE.GHVT01100618.1~~GHVT01100618.1.p1  ORF type:complete len:120 (+),score=0.76 GHVT01100618.1:189-548(+)
MEQCGMLFGAGTEHNDGIGLVRILLRTYDACCWILQAILQFAALVKHLCVEATACQVVCTTSFGDMLRVSAIRELVASGYIYLCHLRVCKRDVSGNNVNRYLGAVLNSTIYYRDGQLHF